MVSWRRGVVWSCDVISFRSFSSLQDAISITRLFSLFPPDFVLLFACPPVEDLETRLENPHGTILSPTFSHLWLRLT